MAPGVRTWHCIDIDTRIRTCTVRTIDGSPLRLSMIERAPGMAPPGVLTSINTIKRQYSRIGLLKLSL